jgi:hypothetical protein
LLSEHCKYVLNTNICHFKFNFTACELIAKKVENTEDSA